MTAAGPDYVSGGRFTPGWEPVVRRLSEAFTASVRRPLGCTSEVIEICRKVWRREPLDYDGNRYRVPLRKENGGSGLGRRLKIINHPVRTELPVSVAALGIRNVASSISDSRSTSASVSRRRRRCKVRNQFARPCCGTWWMWSLMGDEDSIRSQVTEFPASRVRTFLLNPLAGYPAERVEQVRALAGIVAREIAEEQPEDASSGSVGSRDKTYCRGSTRAG